MEPKLAKNDFIRVRALGTNDDWCICRVDLISANGLSIGTRIVKGMLRVRSGFVGNVVLILVNNDQAFEAITGIELEVELYS